MSRYRSWLVPTAAVVLIGGSVAASASASSRTPDLAERSPADLLAAIAVTDVTALSGTIRTEADLGFPQLPTMGGATAASDPQAVLTRLLAGDNTIRVWVDGEAESFRAALVDDFSELEVVGDGSEVWTYSSSEGVATRYELPTGDGPGDRTSDLQDVTPQDVTPQAMAAKALESIDETTEVTVGAPQIVAGRDAYTLVVEPRTTATLVESIEIAVDADTSVPLQVQVLARGQENPAFSTGFTAVDFTTPEADIFDFTPPAGADVVEGDLFTPPTEGADRSEGPEFTGKPEVLGSGWATIVELPSQSPGADGQDSAPGESDDADTAAALLDQLTEPVEGGRAVSTSLLSILFTDDGRVLVGSVPVDALVTAAR